MPIRLYDLDPDTVALAAFEQLLAQVTRITAALGSRQPDVPAPQKSHVYRQVSELARWAIEGKPPRTTRVAERAADLAQLCGVRITGEPALPLELVLQGAVARTKLEAGEPLDANEISILIGFDRDSVIGLAARVPGGYRLETALRKPWRFKSTSALRTWIDEKSGGRLLRQSA